MHELALIVMKFHLKVSLYKVISLLLKEKKIVYVYWQEIILDFKKWSQKIM